MYTNYEMCNNSIETLFKCSYDTFLYIFSFFSVSFIFSYRSPNCIFFVHQWFSRCFTSRISSSLTLNALLLLLSSVFLCTPS